MKNPFELPIRIFKTVEEAPRYDQKDFQKLSFTEVVVVRNGTVEGRSTCDLVFSDATGKQYVVMVTGRIMKMISAVVGDEG